MQRLYYYTHITPTWPNTARRHFLREAASKRISHLHTKAGPRPMRAKHLVSCLKGTKDILPLRTEEVRNADAQLKALFLSKISGDVEIQTVKRN